jgi:hypothetical protein
MREVAALLPVTSARLFLTHHPRLQWCKVSTNFKGQHLSLSASCYRKGAGGEHQRRLQIDEKQVHGSLSCYHRDRMHLERSYLKIAALPESRKLQQGIRADLRIALNFIVPKALPPAVRAAVLLCVDRPGRDYATAASGKTESTRTGSLKVKLLGRGRWQLKQ